MEKWAHRLSEQPERGTEPRRASNRGAGPHVLIADEAVPAPDRDGGSRRMWKVVEALRGLGCAVTMLPAGGEAREPYASMLEVAGVEVLRSPNEVESELAGIGPDLALAILSRPHVASRYVYMLRELAPFARVVYDIADLHFVREMRRAQVEGRPPGPQVDALRELELAMVRCCDTTVAVSAEERETLLELVPGADVRVLPAIQEPVADVAPLDGRAGIVFVGSFAHSPNVDAATFLVREVMPHVWRERPDAALRIVGTAPPPEVAALAGPRVEVAGWVEDLAGVLDQTRVAVAPLRYGAGVKLKTVDAMAHGIPVVSTTIGAEGVGAADGDSILVADEPSEIADRLVALLATMTSGAGSATVLSPTCASATRLRSSSRASRSCCRFSRRGRRRTRACGCPRSRSGRG